MPNPEDWLERVVAHAIAWHLALRVTTEYAESGLGVAQYRLRIHLVDGSLLQCVERVRMRDGVPTTEKYSFHWQHADGRLICRWDNAPHHRELTGFPHHLHETHEDHVHPHPPATIFSITELIESRIHSPT